MSHQDKMSKCVTNHETLKQVVDWLLPVSLFAGKHVRHGSKWKPRMLAVAALLWGGGDGPTLAGRFEQGRKIVMKVFRWQLAPGETYQGFIKVLRSWHLTLMAMIVPAVRMRMEQELSGRWQIAGFVVYAGDGSRVELPRTKSNEDAYAPSRHKRRRKGKTKTAGKRLSQPKRGGDAKPRRATEETAKSQSAEAIAKKSSSPQMWLTLLWHVGTGLPWDWRTGPSDSSERGHLQEMLGKLPENSLITADAGFVGFDFWRSILTARHHFLIRVGGNVQLLKQLGYAREFDHTVYLWPDGAAKKNSRLSCCA